jgi:hypothetical protein
MSYPNITKYVYIDPEGSYISSLSMYPPPATMPQPIHWPRIRDTQSLQWGFVKYPFLGFIPKTPVYEGPLLDRLAYNYRTIPIEKVQTEGGQGWHLSPDLQGRWHRLECGLCTATCHLLSYWTSLNYRFYPMPSIFGYGRVWESESTARHKAILSRDAFLPLLAMCSWSIAMHLPRNGHYQTDPKWIQLLVQEKHMVVEWVNNLHQFMVEDFEIERIGAVFNPHLDSNWHNGITQMTKTGVPVWINWGKNPLQQSQNRVADLAYAPSLEQLREARHTFSGITTRGSSSKFSRQLSGETWQQYFARQNVVIAKYIDQETHHQTLIRQQHEYGVESQSFSGPNGARVFYWMKSNEQGFRLRTEVPEQNVERIWSSYRYEQKRYTSFFHEWDICSDFDPCEMSDDHEMGCTDNSEEEYSLDQSSLPQILASAAMETHIYVEDLEASYSGLGCYPNKSAKKLVELNDDFKSILYTRYGLLIHNGHVSVTTGTDVILQRKALGDNTTLLDEEWEPTLECLVEHLNLDASSLELPREVPYLDRDVFTTEVMNGLLLAAHLIVTPFFDSKGLVLYGLRPKNQAQDRQEWNLVVQDPVTVLQCLRAKWGEQDLLSLALELAQQAIPFRTLKVFQTPSEGLYSEPRYDVGLGWRPKSWTPGLCEYRIYEAIRNKFFNHEHSRAAFLAGGVVWRLAVESLGTIDMDRIQKVSSSAPFKGFHHESNYLGDAYDDCLAEDEENLICGVYKVETGM